MRFPNEIDKGKELDIDPNFVKLFKDFIPYLGRNGKEKLRSILLKRDEGFINMVATNGSKMILAKIKGELTDRMGYEETVIDYKTIEAIQKIKEIPNKIFANDENNNISFVYKYMTITRPLSKGYYPSVTMYSKLFKIMIE